MEAKTTSPSSYLKGVAALLVLFLLNVGSWYLFFSPKGVMRLYTPMYGFSIIVVLFAVIVTLSDALDAWPLKRGGGHFIGRGVVLTVSALILTLFLIYGVFYNFIGRFGITYFSPASIVATHETGSEIFNARENASTALVYLFAAYIWLATTWRLCFGNWPWNGIAAGAAVFSRWVTISFFTAIAYAVLFHPHIGVLFYPPQKMAAVSPWWEALTDTNSAYFHLGWVICSVAVVTVSEILWEEYPWRLIGGEGRGTLLRGVVTLLGTVLLGFAFFYAMKVGMDLFWGKAFVGGQYLDAPYFRYLHAAEMAAFVIMGALIVETYLGNLFTGSGPLGRGAARTVAAVVIGALMMWFYYAAGPAVLGTVPGIAQPEDTPLCWSFFMIGFLLVHRNFFHAFPLRGDA